jgi:hypothetical protein
MRTMRATTTLALVAALPLELVNYFFVGYPAGTHFAIRKDWFVAIAAQWYVLHLPGIFALNEFGFLRDFRSVGAIVLFLSGLLDTTLLLAVLIWPALMILRILRYPPLPLKPGN